MIRSNRVVDAIERNPVQLWRYVASHTTGAAFETLHGATMVSLPFPHPLFNSVLVAEIPRGEEDAAIDAAKSFFGSRSKPWNWTVGPASKPANLPKLLLDHGFTHLFDTPGMAIDLRGRSMEVDEDIVDVRDQEGLLVWLEMVTRGFGLPEGAREPFIELHQRAGWQHLPVRYFYVERDGEPVAFSMNFYGAGVAGIYCVATVAEARRQGLGIKAMNACLAAAIEDGYDVAILHSSRMGLPLYEKLGFKTYCTLANYGPPEG